MTRSLSELESLDDWLIEEGFLERFTDDGLLSALTTRVAKINLILPGPDHDKVKAEINRLRRAVLDRMSG